jgi:hypothetical protein
MYPEILIQMNDNQIQYFTKLSARTFFSMMKIYALGVFSTVLVLVIGSIILLGSLYLNTAPHAGVVPYMVFIFTIRPLASILLLLLLFLSPVLFFVFGKKYVISKAINQIVQEKSDTWILPLLAQSIEAFQIKHPAFFQSVDTFVVHKLRFIQNIKNDTSQHIWKRKTLAYLLKKIRLDDVDVRHESSTVGDVITTKVKGYLETIAPPSRKSILLLVLIQWIFLLLIWKTKY